MVIVLVTTLDVGGSNMPRGNNDQEEIMPECTEQIESITECILNISEKYTGYVTENCAGMTKINTYITQNDGLHRPT